VLANTPGRIGVNEILVRRFLALPNISFEVVEDSCLNSAQAARQWSSILRRYQPRILHLNLAGFIGVYPWLAKLFGADAVYFTAHGSHLEGYAPRMSHLSALSICTASDSRACVY
jgi:hypothetical protein